MNGHDPQTPGGTNHQGNAPKKKKRRGGKLPSLGTIFDLIWRLISTRDGRKTLVLIVLASLVILLGLHWAGYAVQFSSPYVIRTVESTQGGALAEGITKGIQNRKAYVIEAATMWVRVDDEAAVNEKTNRHISERITYTLRPLRNISSEEMKTFHEHYHFPDAKSVLHWSGTDEESDIVGGSDNPFITSNVLFDAKRGVNYTLVTGADVKMELPLKERVTHTVHLNAFEDGHFYPNEDDDIICELLIVIESFRTPIKAVDAIKMVGGRTAKTEHTQVRSSTDSEGGTVLSARFSNIGPGDIVALVYSWK